MVRSQLKQNFLDCAAGSDAACEEAFHEVQPALRRVTRRLAFQYGAADEHDDVQQHVLAKLAEDRHRLVPLLPDDANQLAAYLSIFAANAARDWFRARNATKRGLRITRSLDGEKSSLAELVPGATPDFDRQILLDQIERAVEGDPRDCLVFRLHYRQGYPANVIAQIPAIGLSTKGVETVLHRMRARVRTTLGLEGNRARKASS